MPVVTNAAPNIVEVYPTDISVLTYPEQTKVTVADGGETVVVSLAATQGPQGPQGPQGDTGPVGIPNFYETSNPPLGAVPGDQWIVTTSLGE